MKQDKLPKCGSSARVDKWLWAARIYKTRSVAADAIKNGRVTIEGSNVKPSRTVKEGDIISVKKPPITYSFKILACIEQRVGAKLLPQVFENVTDPKQYELLEMSRISGLSIASVAPDVLRRRTAVPSITSSTPLCSDGMTTTMRTITMTIAIMPFTNYKIFILWI